MNQHLPCCPLPNRLRTLPAPVQWCLLALLACWILLQPAGAQDSATGTVTGRVLNLNSGRYVGAVVVTVEGTSLQAQTNDFGEFTLRGVPAGEVVVRATYRGQDPLTATVNVPAGGTATQNFRFGRGPADGSIVLDEFTVAENRFRTAREIAINEERSSINIKNVVSADAFGDIPSSNVGEFVKFLPGVQIDYGAFNNNNQGYNSDDATGVSIRGFGPEDTAILIDGLPVSSATPGNLSRQVGLDQLAINNASRVEIIKVATPDMPNNSIGGQVNLITKSAFEYAKPQYSGRVFFNVNSQNADLKKTPGPVSGDSYKITPGGEFTVTYPFSDKFGISVTGFGSREANQDYRATPYWNNRYGNTYSFTNSAGEAGTWENPILTRYQITDTGSLTERLSGNLRLDWRPTPSQLLRANFQYSTFESEEAQRRLDFRPTISAPMDWGPDFVIGRDANSNTAMTVTTRDRTGDTETAQLQYEFNANGWRISAAGSFSRSTSEFEDRANGHFSEVALNLNPGRVELLDIVDGKPGNVVTYWRSNAGAQAGTVKDFTRLENWVFDGTTAKSGQGANRSTKSLYKVDVERDLDFLPFVGTNSLTFKTGFRRDEEKEEKWGLGINYREILRPGASYTVLDILDEEYEGQSPGFGLPAQQWASTYKLFEIDQANDIFYVPDFDESTNTRVENYISWVNQQKSMTETTDAWYAMLSGRFFRNRLAFNGGFRQEEKTREGYSPYTDPKWNFLRRPDGSLWWNADYPGGVQIDNGTNRPLFADTPAGQALRATLAAEGINYPTTPLGPVSGANQSFESKQLQLQPNRYVKQRVKGDPSYSLSTAYELTDDLVLKAAVSRSFGMPDLEDGANGLLSGNNTYTIEEYTDTQQQTNQGALGQIRVANPGLLPEESTNFDLELAYYTKSGGKLGVSWFHKNVTNQTMSFTTFSGTPVFDTVVSALGLDPADYDDWRLVTSSNASTDQKTQGWEFEARQDLSILGGIGRHFQVFATYSFNDLADPVAPLPFEFEAPDGSIVTLTPSVKTITKRANRFGSAGIQFATRRILAQLRGTYRNANELQQTVINNGENILRRMEPSETRVDLSVTYSFSERFSFFVSARDIFNGRRRQIYEDDQGRIPGYANLYDERKFGVDWTFGVNARF